MKKFLELFGVKSTKQKDDFADFFLHASSREQKKVLKRVVRKANDDQKKYLDAYEKLSRCAQ